MNQQRAARLHTSSCVLVSCMCPGQHNNQATYDLYRRRKSGKRGQHMSLRTASLTPVNHIRCTANASMPLSVKCGAKRLSRSHTCPYFESWTHIHTQQRVSQRAHATGSANGRTNITQLSTQQSMCKRAQSHSPSARQRAYFLRTRQRQTFASPQCIQQRSNYLPPARTSPHKQTRQQSCSRAQLCSRKTNNTEYARNSKRRSLLVSAAARFSSTRLRADVPWLRTRTSAPRPTPTQRQVSFQLIATNDNSTTTTTNHSSRPKRTFVDCAFGSAPSASKRSASS